MYIQARFNCHSSFPVECTSTLQLMPITVWKLMFFLKAKMKRKMSLKDTQGDVITSNGSELKDVVKVPRLINAPFPPHY